MGLQKSRRSPRKQGHYRGHDALSIEGRTICDNCKLMKKNHYACINCGFYKKKYYSAVRQKKSL